NRWSEVDRAGGGGAWKPGPGVGTTGGVNGGQVNSAFSNLETVFLSQWAADTSTHTILNQDGTTAYSGRGWEVYVPVVNSTCNADGSTSQINGSLQVVGWTRFIMTQMWDPTGSNPSKNASWNSANGSCLVNNPDDSTTWTYCTSSSPPSPLNSGNSRSVWGYYDCGQWNAPPAPPGPRTALSTKLRVTQQA